MKEARSALETRRGIVALVVVIFALQYRWDIAPALRIGEDNMVLEKNARIEGFEGSGPAFCGHCSTIGKQMVTMRCLDFVAKSVKRLGPVAQKKTGGKILWWERCRPFLPALTSVYQEHLHRSRWKPSERSDKRLHQNGRSDVCGFPLSRHGPRAQLSGNCRGNASSFSSTEIPTV